VKAAAFSRDGRRVVTGSWDGTARLWDSATGRPLGPPLPHAGKVWAAAFCPEGRTLVTGSEDCKARLWRLPPPLEGTGEQVGRRGGVAAGRERDAEGGLRVLDAVTGQHRGQRQEALAGPPGSERRLVAIFPRWG